jgi:dUTP pyrophosphatase
MSIEKYIRDFNLVYALTRKAKSLGIDFKCPREGDNGYDLYSTEDCMIVNGESILINTGVRVKLPKKHVGILFDRSSMAGENVFITAGVIDESYRGVIHVRLNNAIRKEPYLIKQKDKIAQMLVVPSFNISPFFEKSEKKFLKMFATERNENGFGSTGK